MLLSASSAKALAAIALCSMLGPRELKARLPFRVISSGSYWVVRGRLGPESRTKPFFHDFHVYIDKSTAEMRDVATGGMKPFKIPPSTMRILRESGWRPPKRNALGLPLNPHPSASPPELAMVLYNGIIGTPKAAIAYARVLMRASPRLAGYARDGLRAEAHDDVWHITTKTERGIAVTPNDLLTFSQANGKVLSGGL